MNLKTIIQLVDSIKPNAFPIEAKVRWLNECEGLVQTEVMLLAPEEVLEYTWEENQETEMLALKPHHKIYWVYLLAMIDLANNEYDKYNNTVKVFNDYFVEYQKWYARTYRPADGKAAEKGYYLSAYGLALKHGFVGTVEEWLESLVGPKGAPFTYDDFTPEQLEALRGPAGVGEPGQPGLPGKDGKPGFSPVVTVTKIANGHRVAITDANGTKTFDVMDGEDGEGGGGGSGENGTTFYPYVDENGNLSWTNDGGLENPETVNIKGPEGKPGQNGYSPVVTVAAISGGHRVTVTDKSGTKTFDVMDGGDGAPGKTPVKGTDYWTAADKQEIIEDLKDEGVGGATVLTATIGTNWTDNGDGTKSQTVSLSGVTAANNAQVDAYYNGGEYADFVEAQNQFLEFITNGYAETVAGGIKFVIFGESNTVIIPIIVEVV